MKIISKTILIWMVICLFNSFAEVKATPLYKAELEEARKNHKICENANGDIEPTAAGKNDPHIAKLVAEVNKKRKEHYEGLAQQHNVPVDEERRAAAEKLRQKYKPCS